jgi:hypothetical protein
LIKKSSKELLRKGRKNSIQFLYPLTYRGQAQEATRLRNEKLDELNDYTTELKAIAELALEGQPQLLEKLGIVVRS